MSLKINNDTANGSVTLQASNTATGDVVATLPPFSTELAPRMQLMTAKTASGTSVDFTGIPSWAKKITVIFKGVSTSGSSPIQVQLGYSGGVVTSGYLSAGSYGASGYSINSGFMAVANMNASYTNSGTMQILNISGNLWVESVTMVNNSSSVNTTVGVGDITLSGALTTIRITTVNGTDTFDAGTINILVEG